MRRALLLVDLQNDFLGAHHLEPPAGELIRKAAELLDGCRAAAIPVLHAWTTTTRRDEDDRMPHWRAANRWDCVEGTRGHEAPAKLRPVGEPCFDKTYFSAFSNPRLERVLEEAGTEELILAGVHLHGCVRATALDAYQRGLRVVIAREAVGGYDGVHDAVTMRWLGARVARFEGIDSILARVPGKPSAAAAPGRDAEVQAATDAAARSGGRWRATKPEARAVTLERAASLLEARVEDFAGQIVDEIGKPRRYARLEALRGVALLRAAARLAVPVPSETSEAVVRRVPLGLVAQITPWNNPLAVPLGKLAPALRLGNSVVWKPSPLAPAVAEMLLELLREAKLHEGLVSIVHGGAETAANLIDAAPVAAVSLTGSSAAGYAAQAICAERRIPLQAELGGNNAAIVWRDCDLVAAAGAIAEAGFGCAGQRCTANRRVVIDEACFEPFIEALERATAALVMGDPDDPAVQVGPLVNESARERVAGVLERAGAGADVRRPGGSPSRMAGLPSSGRYLLPALVIDPDPASEVVRRESFGPVVVVQRVSSFERALALANDVEEGLVAALFSKDSSLQEAFLAEAHAGVLKLNRATVDVGVETPFGGWGRSGVGPPEHGEANVDFYTRRQAIYRS